MAPSLGGLVDAENGFVSRRICIEREIYAQELERIFAHCWLEFLDPERSRHLPRRDDDRHVQPLDGQLTARRRILLLASQGPRRSIFLVEN